MNVLRVRALRWALFGAMAAGAGAAWVALHWVTEAAGRTGNTGPVASSLAAAATLEAQRVKAEIDRAVQEADGAMLQAMRLPMQTGSGAPVPWVPGMCAIAWPKGVARAGLVDGGVPAGLVELASGKCLERMGTLAAQALTGPPYPAAKDVARAAQGAVAGTGDAVEGEVRTVLAYREGTAAVIRVARKMGNRVAWLEVPLSALPAAPATGEVRLDSLVVKDGVEVGYALGGPKAAAVTGALEGIRGGTTRALDLEDVARESAAQGVIAARNPDEDDGRWAFSQASVRAVGVEVVVVASTPWPAAAGWRVGVAAAAGILGALLMLVLQMVTARRLANALWGTAREVREAWLGLREDDVGSDEDARRAQVLVDAMAARTGETLEAAFGKAERFWAPAPVERLVQVVRERVGRVTPW